jgi:signal transduction histidine kinase
MTSLKRNRRNGDSNRSKNRLSTFREHLQKQPSLTLNDQIPVPFATLDIYGFIVDHNDLFSSLFNLPSESALNKVSFSDLVTITSHKKFENLLDQSNAGRNNDTKTLSNFANFELIWLNRGDGSVFPARVCTRPYVDVSGKIVGRGVVVIDDTSNYDALKRIEQEREDLKKKDQFKNEFVTIASHELRTPIQPILGFALLATQGLMPQDQAWEGVLSEARRLQQLANDILDVSRIDSAGLGYEFQYIRISEVIVNTIESLKTDMKKKISIIISVQEGTQDLEIEADKSRMAQVISNIVGNSIKFTEKGVVRIESRVFKDQNRFELRVSDSGRGISDDIMARLFEKFVTKNHGDATTHGTGLGLYITKAIVDAHMGKIFASNNSDGGATFVIELPISRKLEMISKT